MVKKLIYITIALAIIAAGYTGFTKLNYWPRSARVFSYNPDQAFGGRGGRERRGSEGRSHFHDDSRSDNQRPQRGESGRGGNRNEKEIYLRNVLWFLSVFAAFTVLTVYSDKMIRYAKTKPLQE
jgi:hypothetical protein